MRGEEGEGVAQPDDVEVALQHLLHGCGVCVIRASSRPGRARIWGSLRGGNHERLVKAGRSGSEAGAAGRSTEYPRERRCLIPISPHISPHLPISHRVAPREEVSHPHRPLHHHPVELDRAVARHAW